MGNAGFIYHQPQLESSWGFRSRDRTLVPSRNPKLKKGYLWSIGGDNGSSDYWSVNGWVIDPESDASTRASGGQRKGVGTQRPKLRNASERNSIKHASTDELASRIGDAMRSYDHVASMDFGSFDGSCTEEVRSIAENAILISLSTATLLAGCWSDGVCTVESRVSCKSLDLKKSSKDDRHLHGCFRNYFSGLGRA